LLGNDIVDLQFCEPPTHRHVRYLDRVCTPQEAQAVRRSANPVKALAVLWASKEATYKLHSKDLGLCHFVPMQFAAEIENSDPARIDEKLSVLHAGVHTEVSLFANDCWVHAVATASVVRVDWRVWEIEKCMRGAGRASSESESVRFLARALLDELGLEDVSLQFDGRVPRLKRKDGSRAEMDVSLSHHGAYAAVAIAWPSCRIDSRTWDEAGFAAMKSSEAVCSTCTA